MSTVAEQLRQGREAKNLTVYQIAEITKIRTDHVRALEEGDYDVFAAPVYVRGFVRTYANLLKLEVPTILAELTVELSKSAKHCEPPPLTKPRRGIVDLIMFQLSKLNWRLVGPVAAGVLIIILSVLIFRAFAGHKPKESVVENRPPAIYQSSRKPVGDTLPLVPPPQQGKR